MADRYLVNDCNKHYNCCQNSYHMADDAAIQDDMGENHLTLADLKRQQQERQRWLRRLLRRREPAGMA